MGTDMEEQKPGFVMKHCPFSSGEGVRG